MIAIDTNVVVRIIVNDDAAQVKRAMQLIKSNSVVVGRTVLLECEWVLRASYGLHRKKVEQSLRGFLGLQNVSVSEPESVSMALELYAGGLDFADALHLALAREAGEFATFDAALRKRARKLVKKPEIREP